MSSAGDVVREVIDRAWNRGDLDVLNERVAVGYRREVPDGVVQGRQGFRDRIVATRVAFPDFHTRVDAMIERGDSGVASWTVTATHRGEINGIPPSGRTVSWRGIVWFRVVDGRIEEEWELFDRLSLIEQLTAAPQTA